MKTLPIRTDLSALNPQQKQAVLTENKRVLVLAGAGSGKTKTLLQKLTYLIEDKEVQASNILAITFTRNAANEMIDRLIMSADKEGFYEKKILDKYISKDEKYRLRREYSQKFPWIDRLTIKTFHSLCLQILRNDGVKVFDNRFKILKEEGNSDDFGRLTARESAAEVLQKVVIQFCEDRDNLLELKRYFLDFYVDKIKDDKATNNDFRPEGKFYTTLRGDKVRSKSEQFIADWLYRNKIDYDYEPSLHIDFEFHPDFYIPQANIYLEHVSNKSKGMLDKEEQYRKGGKTLVKTHEEMARDSTIFSRALERIVKERLPGNYLSATALSYEDEFKRYHYELRQFYRDMKTVLSHIKAENLELAEVVKKGRASEHDRVKGFYYFAGQILREYKNYCVSRSYIDFDDMILLSLKLLNEFPEVRKKYQNLFKHILVDEFQDVNSSQVELLKLLISADSQLFCVGDDWQSIYGFRGSEVDYILNFSRHFDDSQIIKLNVNYRSNESIVFASNEIIKHNKSQIEKTITAIRKSPNKIEFYRAADLLEQADFIANEVDRHLQNGVDKDDILILYRRSGMLRDLNSYWKETGRSVNCAKKTIHSSKGLEAKVVFIIGLTQGYGGFPDVWMSDKIYQVIKESDHQALLEEERRLFYVAVTRAKDTLYLVTIKGNESQFLQEIPKQFFSHSADALAPVVERLETCGQCYCEITENWKFCPSCGNLLRLTPEDEEKKILEALREIPFTPGRTWLTDYLCGLNREDVQQKNILGSQFGAFENVDSKEVKDAIDRVIDCGKIEKFTKNGYPVLRLSNLD